MGLQLKLHPDCACSAVERIEAQAWQPASGQLSLRYVLTGAIAGIRLALPAPSARGDELWRSTCFEAFVSQGAEAYAEFNFSPSTQWAAYHFNAYREGMQNAPGAPIISVRSGDRRFELEAALALPPGARRLGLSAVIEETNGVKSYWALAHPASKPDFHHRDSFAYELGP
jgi:hypothetical protein